MNIIPTYNEIGQFYDWDQQTYPDYHSKHSHLSEKIEEAKDHVEKSIQAAKQIQPYYQNLSIAQIYQKIAEEKDRKNNTSVPGLVSRASLLEKFIANKVVEQIQISQNIEKIEAVKATLFLGMVAIHKLAGSLNVNDSPALDEENPALKLAMIIQTKKEALNQLKAMYNQFSQASLPPHQQLFLQQVLQNIQKVEGEIKQEEETLLKFKGSN